MLTQSQLTVLKNDILADPILSAYPNNSDGNLAIAAAYGLVASPDFWVWRTRIPQEEIVGDPSPDGTVWSWTAYISRSLGEQAGWREMFADTGSINAARPNVRQGLADIFSGAGGGRLKELIYWLLREDWRPELRSCLQLVLDQRHLRRQWALRAT